MYSDELLKKTKILIQEKYLVNEENSIRYAELALDGLFSHGGNPNDYSSVVKAVDVVVQSWIDEEVVQEASKP